MQNNFPAQKEENEDTLIVTKRFRPVKSTR